MSYRIMFAGACLSAALLALPLYAQDHAPMMGGHEGFCERMQETTLEEARMHAKRHLDELTAMTPKEWEARKEKFHDRCMHHRERMHERRENRN